MSAVAVIVLQKSARISELLEEKVGVKGPDLAERIHRARRILPRDALAAGRRIIAAERMARRGGIVAVDANGFDEDYRVLQRCLQGMEAGTLRRRVLASVITGGLSAFASGLTLGVGLAYSGLI